VCVSNDWMICALNSSSMMPCMLYMLYWDLNWWDWYERIHDTWWGGWLDIAMRLLCMINLWLVG